VLQLSPSHPARPMKFGRPSRRYLSFPLTKTLNRRVRLDADATRISQNHRVHRCGPVAFSHRMARSLSDRVQHSAIITGVACFHRTSAQRYKLKMGAIGPYRSVARQSGGNGGRRCGVCLPTFLA
jgi:hypothetical protein